MVKWTPAEDARLKEEADRFIYRDGSAARKPGRCVDWAHIAAEAFPGQHDAKQCEHRWKTAIWPGQRNAPWARAEDEAILRAAQRHLAAAGVPHGDAAAGSTGAAAEPGLPVAPRELVLRQPPADWGSLLPNRTAKMCYDRWRSHLDPSIQTRPWTTEEDEAVVRWHDEAVPRPVDAPTTPTGHEAVAGPRPRSVWQGAGAVLGGRSDAACRQRWTMLMNNRVRYTFPLSRLPHLEREVGRLRRRLPEGARLLQPLRAGDHAALLAATSHSARRGCPRATSHVHALLQSAPSAGIEVHGELVAWCLVHDHGAIGLVHTHPSHRRKGYAQCCVAHVAAHLCAQTTTEADGTGGMAVPSAGPFAHVLERNTASRRLFEGLGFTIDLC